MPVKIIEGSNSIKSLKDCGFISSLKDSQDRVQDGESEPEAAGAAEFEEGGGGACEEHGLERAEAGAGGFDCEWLALDGELGAFAGEGEACGGEGEFSDPCGGEAEVPAEPAGADEPWEAEEREDEEPPWGDGGETVEEAGGGDGEDPAEAAEEREAEGFAEGDAGDGCAEGGP